ncbi:hypothetical protein PC118_g21135 [Phytophthora cactorum]|uniref:Uncharacterized protein n=1 Tax=Phytophthora cactorum TaxID=29920 RepID=A0A8T1EWS3_9STRA|nr:hypothetical protein PC118_g21135 [Phytophthora cactorum]KAG2980238.1 hypothetical protein PC119_g21317 [Phytophthora cactorum]
MIPKHLVIKLSAVVGAEKMKRKGSDYFDNNSESDHPEDVTTQSNKLQRVVNATDTAFLATVME